MVFDMKSYKKEYNKKYREKNRDKINTNRKEYNRRYSQSEKGKKRYKIQNWKQRGLIHDDYHALYEKYINTDKCDVCNKVFENTTDKCMDHDHETGLFRHVLCRSCNTKDSWKYKQQN